MSEQLLWSESLAAIEAEGSDGKTLDVPVTGGVGTILVSIHTDDADPDGADAQVSIDCFLLNHRGNIAKDDSASGTGRAVFYNSTRASGKSTTSGPYKFIDSADGSVIATDLVCLPVSHGRACLIAEAVRLKLRADEGGGSWDGGNIHLKIMVLPGATGATGF